MTIISNGQMLLFTHRPFSPETEFRGIIMAPDSLQIGRPYYYKLKSICEHVDSHQRGFVGNLVSDQKDSHLTVIFPPWTKTDGRFMKVGLVANGSDEEEIVASKFFFCGRSGVKLKNPCSIGEEECLINDHGATL